MKYGAIEANVEEKANANGVPTQSQLKPLREELQRKDDAKVPVAVSPATISKIRLCCKGKCDNTRPGESLFVVGSLPEMGAWNPEKAVPCTTTADEFPLWTSEAIPASLSATEVEFKFIIRGNGKVRWEDGANHKFKLPSSCSEKAILTVKSAWCNPNVSTAMAG